MWALTGKLHSPWQKYAAYPSGAIIQSWKTNKLNPDLISVSVFFYLPLQVLEVDVEGFDLAGASRFWLIRYPPNKNIC